MKKIMLPLTLGLLVWSLAACRGKQPADPKGESAPAASPSDASQRPAAQAAPAPALPANDRLKPQQADRFFRTSRPVEEYEDYLYCTNSYDVEWPEELAHCPDIRPLHDSLFVHLFGARRAKTFDEAAEHFLSLPLFRELDVNDPYEVVKPDRIREEEGTNHWQTDVTGRMAMTSPRLAVYSVRNSGYSGGAHGYYGVTYLVFDRQAARVWTMKDAFAAGSEKRLLKLVNRRIERLIEEGKALLTATALTQFYPGKEGITFVFQPYEVASYADGIVEVTVPYAELDDCLNPAFKACLQQPETFRFLLPDRH